MLSRHTLTSQVIDYLLDLIKTGSVKPGEKLPTEKELTKELGISRTCVREAVKSLESLRLVRVRPKIGAVVLEPSAITLFTAEHFLLAPEMRRADALLEFRLILEVGLASLAAEKAGENDIRTMQTALADFKQGVDAHRVCCEADLGFHSAVVAAAQNPIAMVAWQMISARMAEVLGSTLNIPNVGEDTFRDHVRIFRAIKEHNPKKAGAAMRAHLVGTAERYWQIARVQQSSCEVAGAQPEFGLADSASMRVKVSAASVARQRDGAARRRPAAISP